MSLSRRCLKGLEVDNGPQELNELYFGNPYDETTNPEVRSFPCFNFPPSDGPACSPNVFGLDQFSRG